jgi:hypothetical protein
MKKTSLPEKAATVSSHEPPAVLKPLQLQTRERQANPFQLLTKEALLQPRFSPLQLLANTSIKAVPQKYTPVQPALQMKQDVLQRFWIQPIGVSPEEQITFLYSVVKQARQIIPYAINRRQEFDPPGPAASTLEETKYMCLKTMVGKFAKLVMGKGIMAEDNYIHPAALERIVLLIKEVAAEKKPDGRGDETGIIGGLCKDYASLVYGLIVQNDTGGIFKTELSFIKDHVFVVVKVHGVDYAIDAWIGAEEGNDGVFKKTDHITSMNAEKRRNVKGTTAFNGTPVVNKGRGESIRQQYLKAAVIERLWTDTEADFKSEIRTYLKTDRSYPVAGTM